jgi:hypothetical protein
VAFDLPPEHLALFKALASLNEREIEDFVTALQQGQPAIKTSDYGRSVARKYESSTIDVKESAELLADIWQSADADGENGVQPYIQWLLRQIARHAPEELALGSEASNKLKTLLTFAFTSIPALEVAAKARNLLFSYDNTYQYAVVLTDLRPIFKQNPPEPAAALIVHTLKLTVYGPDGETDEKYIALDPVDLKQLIGVLQRAVRKEDALKKLVEKSELQYLEPSQRFSDE